MSFDRSILEAAHKHAIFNQREILQSQTCGCFYCLETFKPSEIIDWTDDENPKGLTAICPHCNIDAVIGDKAGYPIADENFLKAMYQRWFL
jgi:hypothetical protein